MDETNGTKPMTRSGYQVALACLLVLTGACTRRTPAESSSSRENAEPSIDTRPAGESAMVADAVATSADEESFEFLDLDDLPEETEIHECDARDAEIILVVEVTIPEVPGRQEHVFPLKLGTRDGFRSILYVECGDGLDGSGSYRQWSAKFCEEPEPAMKFHLSFRWHYGADNSGDIDQAITIPIGATIQRHFPNNVFIKAYYRDPDPRSSENRP